jgi:hypothetical protein
MLDEIIDYVKFLQLQVKVKLCDVRYVADVIKIYYESEEKELHIVLIAARYFRRCLPSSFLTTSFASRF